ncbi:MAG: SUMF1/EgtB/PvdO family nonheme iron enzyme [Candidatus Coatesbacteria bacterium]|nr:SUMF1/EgtB/PvdO family nonheme iron enzyme [Candidatus Coatesbacteria bacterium]
MSFLRISSIALIAGLVIGLPLNGPEAVDLRGASEDWPFEGDYCLLCIAIDDYADWPNLSTPVADAEELSSILVQDYGFASQRVVKLYNSQASEEAIMRAFRVQAENLRPEDWLVIFYAGYGFSDDVTGMGAWVPANAGKDNVNELIYSPWVKAMLRAIPAKHILLICDSYFPLDKAEDDRALAPAIQLDRRQSLTRTSREALVSGATKPAYDRRLGKHSVFCHPLLKTLRENKLPYLRAADLYEGLRRNMPPDGALKTRLSAIEGTGSEPGGSFVFVRGRQKELDELDRMIEQKQRKLEELRKRQAQIEALNGERQAKLTEKKKMLEQLDAQIEELTQKLTGSAPSAPSPPSTEKVWTEPNTGMQFVWLPGGCFNMGSPLTDKAHDEDECPVHEVCVDGFWMGKFEVTNGQYRKFKPDHHSGSYEGFSRDGDNQPVVYVSWDDAKAFADYLSKLHGGRYEFRLPTEAEWEYACRAGSTTRYHWGDEIDTRYVNLSDKNHPTHAKHPNLDDGYAVTAPVGSFEPNAFGLYDMAGNVVEWCEDWYAADAYQKSARDNPTGPETGTNRVMRGGSYWAWSWNCRSADRGSDPPDKRRSALGFRLVVKEKK